LKESSEPEIRLRALRALMIRAIGDRDTIEGLEILEAFRKETESPNLDDRLLVLQAVLAFQPEGFEEELREAQKFVAEDPAHIARVGVFLLSRNRNSDVRQWLDSLPKEARHLQPVLTVLIEAVHRMGDLEALAEYLRIEWEQNDYQRLAVLARTLRSLDRAREAADTWQRAVIRAGSNSENLRSLYQLTVQWDWAEERLDLLERVFRSNPREDWAFRQISAIHIEGRNTSELIRIYSRRLEYQPDDRSISNDFAYLCLLQNVHRNRAHSLAQLNFNSDSSNRSYVTTHAFPVASKIDDTREARKTW
jgi:tetratricopeptide (TPR) repeat protein